MFELSKTVRVKIIRRCVLPLLTVLSLVALSACQEGVTELAKPESGKDVGAKLIDFQAPCDCNPYDPDQGVVISETCTRPVPTGNVKTEYNSAMIGLDPRTGQSLCIYTKQVKTEYVETCTISYTCYPSSLACVEVGYQKYIWESETVEVSEPVPCGDGNPLL